MYMRKHMEAAAARDCPGKSSLGVIWQRQNFWVLAILAFDWELHLVPLWPLLAPSTNDRSSHLHLCLAADTHQNTRYWH